MSSISVARSLGRKRIVIGVIAAGLALLLGSVALNWSGFAETSSAAAKGNSATYVEGPANATFIYPLAHDPATVLASADSNELIFVGDLVSIGNADEIRHPISATEVTPGMERLLTIKIQRALKGDLSEGQVIAVRHLPQPGEIEEFPGYAEAAPSLTKYEVGRTYLFLTQELVQLSATPAATPNHVFSVEGDVLVDAYGVGGNAPTTFLDDLTAALSK